MTDESQINALLERNEHPNWLFAKEMHGCAVVVNDGLKPGKNTQGHRLSAAKHLLVAEINILGHTNCRACSGWGHTHKVCPTSPRVTQIAGSNITMVSMVAEIRRKLDISSHTTRGKYEL